jgi:hypothetical protein
MKPSVPQIPEELRDQLFSVFPSFATVWGHEDNPYVENGVFTFHGLLLEFTPFLGRNLGECSQNQLKALASLVNEALEKPGPLENAFDTCFLEAIRKGPVAQALKPHLSAKVRSHA